MAASHHTEFYIVFDAVIWGSIHPSVQKVRAVKISKSKPNLRGGEVALKFSVNIPDAAFLRLIPDVAVTVPDSFWTSQPMEVVLCDPDDAEATK